MPNLTPTTLKYMGATQKVLDIGAAIDQLATMKEEVGKIVDKYDALAEAILDAYSKPDGKLPYVVLDQQMKNSVDEERREVYSGLNKAYTHLDKFIYWLSAITQNNRN